jgi:Phosphotransferase enzyme family
MSSVLQLRDASGVAWFLKHHRDRGRYSSELAAYRNWVPALLDAAPLLCASDDSLLAMMLSAVPGEAARWPSPEATGPAADRAAERRTQREAGKILRRLHEAQPALPWPDFAAVKVEEFGRLRLDAAGLLRPRDLALAGAEVAALAEVTAPARVPCHHDYTPRNWLVQNGALSVIDFEWCGLDAWTADLARLHLGIWPGRPDLEEAFLTGYGRELTPADRQILHGCAVLTGVWLLVRAHETGQPSFEAGSRKALLRIINRTA